MLGVLCHNLKVQNNIGNFGSFSTQDTTQLSSPPLRNLPATSISEKKVVKVGG